MSPERNGFSTDSDSSVGLVDSGKRLPFFGIVILKLS
jgi:hypothetical protein